MRLYRRLTDTEHDQEGNGAFMDAFANKGTAVRNGTNG